MATYLLNSPSSNQVGTNAADLFDLEALQGNTVFGLEGADTITADNALNGTYSAVRLNGGKGADTVTLSAAGIDNSNILMGMGKDVVITDSDLSSTVVRGGAGLDTISLSGNVLTQSTVNGNDMADIISASVGDNSTSFMLAAGLGKDVMTANFVDGSASNFTINGGAGHDSVSVSAAAVMELSSGLYQGGNGKDTITFDANASKSILGQTKIDGGALADKLTFAGAITSVASATIAGNAGADTITFTEEVSGSNTTIGLGLGNDSLTFSDQFFAGSVQGGDGKDTITISTAAISAIDGAGVVYGGAGADKFNLGTANIAAGVDQSSGGQTLGYTTFDQSNLSALDFVSSKLVYADVSGEQGVFAVKSDVVDMSVATDGTNKTIYTSTNGFAVFTSTQGNNVTARADLLDDNLTVGQAMAFSNAAGDSHYVFVQGGAQNSGTADDLIIQVSTAATVLSAANNSSLFYINTATGG